MYVSFYLMCVRVFMCWLRLTSLVCEGGLPLCRGMKLDDVFFGMTKQRQQACSSDQLLDKAKRE